MIKPCDCLRGRSEDDGYVFSEEMQMFVHRACGLPVEAYARVMRRKAAAAWTLMANHLTRS